MTQEATQIRLHMGCGESLRSQMLLTVPRRWQAKQDACRARDLRLPARKPNGKRGRTR